MTFTQTIQSVLAPPHPAGRPFIIGAAIMAALGLVLTLWLFWVGLGLLLFCLYFFRDPERVRPSRPGVLVAPADGRVVSVEQVAPPAELGLGEAPRWRIATFLSVLNVHVNRVPGDGTVTAVAYHAGQFLNASVDKASELNERNALAIRLNDGRSIAVVQIAGLIARRIICHVKAGDPVLGGARFGIIRFGSRTDLYLPEGVLPLVCVGQTMVGGETVMADMPP